MRVWPKSDSAWMRPEKAVTAAPGALRPCRAAWLLAMAAMLSACANDQQRTRAEGATAGALIGALLGHVVGGRDGALTGAAVGGAAGLLVGHDVAEKKQRHAQREDALKAAAAQSLAMADEAHETNEALQQDIAALAGSVQRLQTEKLAATQHRTLAMTTRRQFMEAGRKLDAQLVAVRGELARQEEVVRREEALAQQTREPSPPSALRLVSTGVDRLKSQEQALERAKAQLAQLDARRAF